MGKCNLLKPLSSNNGNFFMFSQYSEDLTIEYTQKDTARVVPSKFIALNLNTKGLNNNTIAEIFQNYYENHCCYWRGQEEYKKSFSWELLLQTLESFNMISVDGGTSPNIKYIGNINIYSNQEVDGMSYNEIYCYIPNDAKEQRWKITNNTKPSEQSDEKIPEYIQGFDENDLQDSATDKYYNELSLKSKLQREPDTNEYIKKFRLHYNHLLEFNSNPTYVNSEQFEINTIIVLYDIKNGDKSVHSNLPMGIYFTGMITDGEINNPITKYVSNTESYDQGTSYGLRICTRYLSQVNIKTLQENIKIDTTISDGIYPENVTVLLSKLNESQLLMSDALNKTVENAENLKNHYNLFKTSKTNVPYIQNINGVPYWFVNGKNTDVKVIDISEIDVQVTSITSNELNDTTINRCLKNGESVPTDSESKYLDFNQLNNFAKSINSEFLTKMYGATKQDISSFKEYVDNTFATKGDVIDTSNFLTIQDADDTYLSKKDAESKFVTTNTLNNVANKSDISVINGKINSIESQLEKKSNVSHTHEISGITGLQDSLDDKANVSHTHEYINNSNIIIPYNGDINNFIYNTIGEQDGVYNIKPNGVIGIPKNSFSHIIINSSFNTPTTTINILKNQLNNGLIIYNDMGEYLLLTIKIMTNSSNDQKYKILTITI